MMHCHKSVFLIRPLKEWELCYPEEIVLVLINQDDIQEKMFEVLGFTKERAHEQFGFLLDAFSYGVPPHAGLAFGVDRICMHMLHTDNIKEVIAFPKVKDASDLMSEAPGTVDPKQLEELGIAIAAEEDEE